MRNLKRYLSVICCVFALTACSADADAMSEQAQDGSDQEAIQSIAVDNSEAEEITAELTASLGGQVSDEAVQGNRENTDSHILIAYFTWADNTVVTDQEASLQSALSHYESMGDADQYGADAISSASILVPGNAARMAEWIQQEVGGDMFPIIVEEPYPSDYEECMDRAADEKAEDARPELTSQVENFEQYDTIFIGFPNWWSSLPMPVLTFVDEYDFSGKTVIPFCTHGTGGIAATVRELENEMPDTAEILEPIGVYRAEILSAQPVIREWLKELGFNS